MPVFREPLNESSASATAALRDGMHGPVTHKCGRRIPYAGRSRFAGPSPCASGRDRIALLGIVDQATTCVVRLVIIPILSATRSAEDLFRGSLGPVNTYFAPGLLREKCAVKARGAEHSRPWPFVAHRLQRPTLLHARYLTLDEIRRRREPRNKC